MHRRKFIQLGASLAGSVATGFALPPKMPVIDTHIHLFDTTRPGGVPWPPKDDAVLYKPSLPERYQRISGPFGIVGAVVVEASPLLSDNDWVLKVAANHPIVVGMIGDLIPGSPDYQKELDRLHQNPLFLGIRCGNLWDRKLSADVKNQSFLDGLKSLAERSLTMDSANPDLDLLQGISAVAEHIPELRIVIDHLPSAPVPKESAGRAEYWKLVHHLSQNKNIFVKLSEVAIARAEQNGGPGFVNDILNQLWTIFGEDHILFASDWPNSDHHATYAETFTLLHDFIQTKSASAQEKFFWKNSIAAYHWRKRLPSQPG